MKYLYTLLTLSLLGFACSTSKITSTWKAENVQPQSFKKVLVLGLINEPDRTIREKMEADIVANLENLGYTAICSCDEFGPKAFENMTEQQALAKLGNSGIDAVLTIVLLDKTKEKFYVPGKTYYSPYSVYQGRFWGYYNTMHSRVYEPGYYVTDTKYFWESNLYSITEATQLLYSAQSQSFDPPSTNMLSYEYAKMVTRDMLKANVIVNKNKDVKLGF